LFACLLDDDAKIHFIQNRLTLNFLFNHPNASTGCRNNLANPGTAFHDKIKPISKTIKSKIPISKSNLTASKPSAVLCKQLQLLVRVPDQLKVSAGINKNLIFLDYQDFCNAKGIQDQVSTIAKGETLLSSYPSPHRPIDDCKMKQSKSLYYQAKELHFDNMVILQSGAPVSST
jgi:hypothetical protein